MKAARDKTLIILMIAAIVEIGIGSYKFASLSARGAELVNGLAILVVVLIVVLFSAMADFRKQSQFMRLKGFGKHLNTVGVLRGTVSC